MNPKEVVEYVYNETIRSHLPRKLAYMDGYIVRSPRLFDTTDVRENVQVFEVTSHRRHTRRGDTVVVVGGGNGVSAIAAAEEVGEDGSVVVYEASSDLVPALKESMALNGVDDRVAVKEAVVGKPGGNIWGPFDGSTTIPATELPVMDVLELDCEGAEMEILQDLPHRPRVLTVEAHPKFGVSIGEVESWLENEGYEVVEDSGTGNIHHFTGVYRG